jgi:hypothetical protein
MNTKRARHKVTLYVRCLSCWLKSGTHPYDKLLWLKHTVKHLPDEWRNATLQKTDTLLPSSLPTPIHNITLYAYSIRYVKLVQGYTNPGRLYFAPWRLISVHPQYGTCFKSPTWRLEFWGGSYIFVKILHSWTCPRIWYITEQFINNNQTSAIPRLTTC